MSSNLSAVKRRFSNAFEENGAGNARVQICYGALFDGKAQCLDEFETPESQLQPSSNHASFISFPVTKLGGFFCLSSKDGKAVAVVDQRTQHWLGALDHIPDVKFDALLTAGPLLKRRKGIKKGAILDGMSVNVFGPQNKAVEDDVADRLAQVSAFLQHPRELSWEIVYSNPQWLVLPGRERNMNHLVGTYINDDSSWTVRARVASEINGILDSLDEVPSEDASQFISPPGVTSQLKRHQIQAAIFILRREPGNCFSQASNAAVSTSMCSRPQERCRVNHGGLIADVMGMGKSLTILTTILSTLEDAQNFPHFTFQSSQDFVKLDRRTPTQATLVVVPSAQLMHNWIAEIERHMPRALKFALFHGQSRPKSPESLASTDVVLTTYGTLAADHKNARVLQNMEWYRVVLDEAHWIRNPSSQQFRAATSLSTNRRWCLTGTPIQNKLDDLASLAQFLRVSPYSDKKAFRENVIDPLEKGGKGCADPLRLYLRKNCLRRTDKCLNLPKLSEAPIYLQLSDEEQKAYDGILTSARCALDDMVSTSSADKTKQSKNEKMTVLFTALTRLRRLCGLGTLPPILSSPGNTGQSTEDSDILCEQCSSGDPDGSLLLKDEQFCPDCSRPLRSKRSAKNTGYLTPFSLPETANGRAVSPLILSMDNGHSTKLLKVRDNVVQVLKDQPGTKHLIFSAWTSTLVYLAQLMQQAGVTHAQINGRTNNAERLRHLRAFQEGSEVSVLLMSIGTGAVGLTLTAASHVHIIEPQWNPSVEEQAIGRAHRMGQTKQVVVMRYIVTRSVEQSIVSLQQKKKNIARFTFDAASGDALSERLEDFQLVLNAT